MKRSNWKLSFLNKYSLFVFQTHPVDHGHLIPQKKNWHSECQNVRSCSRFARFITTIGTHSRAYKVMCVCVYVYRQLKITLIISWPDVGGNCAALLNLLKYCSRYRSFSWKWWKWSRLRAPSEENGASTMQNNRLKERKQLKIIMLYERWSSY